MPMPMPPTPSAPPSRGPVSRRQFVQTSGALGLTLGAAWPATAATPLEAYASATSVKQGGTLNFCVRDPAGSLTADSNATISIVRLAGWVDLTVLTASFNVRNRSVPTTASTTGCGWPSSYSLAVPVGWPSGLYYAFFVGATGSGCCVPFVVRAAVKTATAKVLVQVPVTTAQALNNYGGKSLYSENSTANAAAAKVSFDRPFADRWNYGFDLGQPSLARWLDRNSIAADFCTSIDLHQDSSITNGYSLLLIAGQDAYWTNEIRARFDSFVSAGGNAALFGGNTCWWQARLEAGATGTANRTLVCYKSSSADPDPRAAFKTDNWYKLAPPNAENSSVGLGSKNAAVWVRPAPRPSTPYFVQTEHWVYEGTELKPNDSFAGQFAGDRLDNVDVQWGLGGTVLSPNNPYRVYPTGADGAPDTMTVLAWADARDWQAKAQALGAAGAVSGVGMISIHSRGGSSGAVFNAGTIDWPLGFVAEISGQLPTIPSRMSLNVIRRLTTAHKESAEVRRYDPYLAGLPSGPNTYPIYEYAIGGQPGLRTDPFVRRPDILGTAFRAYSSPLPNTAPVYRYKPVPGPANYPQTPARYRLSLSPNEAVNGWLSAGIAFHALSQPLPNTVPVYRHHKATPIVYFSDDGGWIFLYSTRTVEAGWTFDDLAFYAPSI